jgi:hypothetical protein
LTTTGGSCGANQAILQTVFFCWDTIPTSLAQETHQGNAGSEDPIALLCKVFYLPIMKLIYPYPGLLR